MKFALVLFLSVTVCLATGKKRARDIGISFSGKTGSLNAITDVSGVGVSHVTITDKPAGDLHAVRTGVTAVFPILKKANSLVPAAHFILNGNGELTGAAWLEESGELEGPILITNTYSVGVVRDAVRAWAHEKFPPKKVGAEDTISLPVVTETFDGVLNDINGMHVKKSHVYEALNNPSSGAVAEGAVGSGTGMMCFRFKCGIGTSSRVVEVDKKKFIVGVLVQANFGLREDLIINGKAIGKQITDLMPVMTNPKAKKEGSLVTILATDAPLLPNQIKRIAKRVTMGAAKTGAVGANSSGDIFIGFSTQQSKSNNWKALGHSSLDPLFRATIEATEEAILNSLIAGETMEGFAGNKVYAIPHERIVSLLKH